MSIQIKPGRRRAAKGERGLSAWEEHRLRIRLRKAAAGEAWVENQIVTVNGRRQFAADVFPPGGVGGTGMRWCRQCGRWTPGPSVSLVERHESRGGPVVWATLACDDCRIGEDVERHREVYAALPNLRPAGSQSFVRRLELLSDRAHGRA